MAHGDRERSQAAANKARLDYSRVLSIEPSNARARDSLYQLDQLRTIDGMLEQGQTALQRGDLSGAEHQARAILALNPQHRGGVDLKRNIELLRSRTNVPYPQLRTGVDRPVTLEFRDANLKVIFEVLSQVAGLNFMFDKDMRPDLKATIFVRDV